MEITLSNIKSDVNYTELNLFESHLTHELHRMSEKDFIKKYKNIDCWCDTYEKKALLVSVLKIVGLKIDFTPVYIILNNLDYLDYLDGDLDSKDLNNIYNDSIKEFRVNGIFYNEFGGFADGSYYKHSLYK